MKNPRIILSCLISIVLATAASADWSEITSEIPLNSLEGETLIVGDKAFSNFVINGTGSGGAAPDFNVISVQGVQDDDSNDYGLRFNEFSWSVSSYQSITVSLSFKVSILDEPEYENYFIKDVWLLLTGAGIAGTGVINAGENIWDSFPSDGNHIASLNCYMWEGGSKLVDSNEFDPLKEIYIQTKYIFLDGGSCGIAHFDEFFQFYSQTQIPEPATICLLGLGGLFLFRKKRKKPVLKVKPGMKNLKMIYLLVALAALGSTAEAECVNPVEWHFSLVTYGPNECWDSSICVEPNWPEYNYVWELTHETGPWPAIQVMGSWYDIWDVINPSDKSGAGAMEPLPVVDELIKHIDYPEIEADFYVSIDEDGYGQICIKNVVFGSASGYSVTGARFQGDVTVTGVPEPATIILLGTAGIWIFTRKQKPAQPA